MEDFISVVKYSPRFLAVGDSNDDQSYTSQTYLNIDPIFWHTQWLVTAVKCKIMIKSWVIPFTLQVGENLYRLLFDLMHNGIEFGRAFGLQRLKNQSLYHEIIILQKFNSISGKVLK